MIRSSLSLMVLGSLASVLAAAPPTVTTLSPRGAERGKAVEITVNGTNLSPTARLALPFKANQEIIPEAKPNPAQVRFRLTVDPATPCGTYPIRLIDDGVSPPLLFNVDALPGVAEVEDNNAFAKAQTVPDPCVVNGQCSGGDVDHYRFAARKGQRLVLETHAARLGSAVLPQLRVTDGRGRFLVADDSQALQGDARVIIDVPADDDYVVEVADTRYRGGNPPFYQLRIAESDIVEEVFPLGGRRGETVEFHLRGGTLKEELRVARPMELSRDLSLFRLGLDGVLRPGHPAHLLAVGDYPERHWGSWSGEAKDPRVLDVLPPLTLNGRLEQRGEVHRFQFPVQPNQRYRLAVQAESLGSHLDGVLKVSDQAGKQVALADDVDLPPPAAGLGPMKTADPAIDVTVPAATSLLVAELRDQRGRGGVNYGYRLTIEPALPDFALTPAATEVNVPRGGSASVNVTVTRRGYTGPIQLAIPDLPPTWMVNGGHVPGNGTVGVLTVTASDQAAVPDGPLTIEGRAATEAGEVRRRAEVKLVAGRDGNSALSVLPLPGLALGLASAEPFIVRGPATVEVVRGYSTPVPVTVTRAADQQALAVEVTATVPVSQGQQPPVTFQPASAAAGANSASFTLTAGAAAPDGQVLDVVVQGKAKVANADRLVTGPAVAVTLLRPFTVVPPAPLTLTAGQTVTLKGKLNRQAVFKEAVQVKLDGLPAGVTLATPIKPVPADGSEFAIELKADAKAVATEANPTLTCSSTIAGAAYVHPPVSISLKVMGPK